MWPLNIVQLMQRKGMLLHAVLLQTVSILSRFLKLRFGTCDAEKECCWVVSTFVGGISERFHHVQFLLHLTR